MKIALHDADKTGYPNLALMKISAYHKNKGDSVEWYGDLFSSQYDKVYSSRVFTFTKPYKLYGNVLYGGSGNDIKSSLSDKIEHICPDYDLYDIDFSMGFLTRGCIRNCSFCIVPKKEGKIKKHADIEEFLKHKHVRLMDNNVLASSHGIDQIDKIARLKVKVDFNQGLDARLIDRSIAKKLSGVKWWKPVRLACDSTQQIKQLEKAVKILRSENVTPKNYFVYCIIRDIEESAERIEHLKSLKLDVFAQPYIDVNGTKPTKKQKQLARYTNRKEIFKSTTWSEYRK